MHVMEQLDFFPEFLAANFEQLETAAKIIGRFEDGLIVQRLDRRIGMTRTIARHTRDADLHADIAEALREKFLRPVDYIFEIRSVGMGVGIYCFAALATDKLIDRQAYLTALDVP